MGWWLTGRISGLLFEVTAAGSRRLWGSGRTRFYYQFPDAENATVEEITTLVEGSVFSDNDPPTISNIRTAWWLTSGLDAERGWNSELYRAAQETPEKAVISCQVVPAEPEFNMLRHLVVSFILPERHASIVYQHFYDLMGTPSIRFQFTFEGEEYDFERHADKGGAKSAEEFVAGKPLLLAPAAVTVTFSHGESEPEEGEEWRY